MMFNEIRFSRFFSELEFYLAHTVHLLPETMILFPNVDLALIFYLLRPTRDYLLHKLKCELY